MPKLSVIILVHNEEKKIRPALESAQWADEILVVDDYSTDQTLQIAMEYPVRIVKNKYESYAAQVNWALARAKYDWVFVLDADERIVEPLQKEIRSILESEEPGYDGYRVYRTSLFLGQRIRYCGWQDDYVTRLFNRKQGKHRVLTDHSDITVEGKVGILKNRMLHDTYSDFDEYFMKMKRYSDRGALDLANANKRITWVHLTLRPWFRFVKMYFFRYGFLDGKLGLILCGLTAFYVFTKYAKAWQRQNRMGK